VRAYLDGRLRFGARQKLDSQVLVGTGVDPALRGILNAGGVQSQAKSTDPTFDAIHKAMTKVRVTGRASPNAIAMHPNDWEAIRLTRTADGIYIMGNPSVAGPMTLFGISIALTDAITENTALVGDFANFCQLFERRGVQVQLGYVGDQFTQGKATLRADLRVAFATLRPPAFCKVTGI
jgi:HK97 family phage major capsid protein